MTLATLPKLKCDRCKQPHDLTYYDDGSIRSSTHLNCAKPVPGPPNPPRLIDQGKFWIVATTCVQCGTKGNQVTQMASAVHKTILCSKCEVKRVTALMQAERSNQ